MLSRIRRSMADRDQGFTLIELLVVIIIIGILAAIAIPVFLNQRKKAVDASLKSDLRHVAVVLQTWAVDHPGVEAAPVGTWAYTVAPGPVDGPIYGVKLSPGNVIGLTPSADSVGEWCLFAYNRNASEAVDDDHYLVWRSLLGGYDPVMASHGWCA